jgi:MoxR-like ATPase
VLARSLDRAPKAVQIQALELLRTRRIFTRTAVQPAPRPFLLVAVLADDDGDGKAAALTPHLNDFFYLSHRHTPADGLANLEELQAEAEAARHLTLPSSKEAKGSEPVLSAAEVASLAAAGEAVQADVDVVRYQMNIVSFLRMHRAVGGGITPAATRHFGRLMRHLAPLHGLDYVTPSLVALAARKVYLHRLRVVAAKGERSMQWGSELAAIEAILDGVGPDEVIEEVLGAVPAPV